MKKTLTLMVGVLALSGTVQAKSVDFKFEVNSSGPMLYACNAGIKNPMDNGGEVCHVIGDPYTGCTPTLTTSCECTDSRGNSRVVFGDDNGHDLEDVMRFQVTRWNSVTQKFDGPVEKGFRRANEGMLFGNPDPNRFNKITNSAMDALASRIDWLQFDLSSEVYGAQYFVDFCVRAPQTNYFSQDMNFRVPVDSQVEGAAYLANQHSAIVNYLERSGLNYSIQVVCDAQGAGSYQYGHAGNSFFGTPADYNTLFTDLSLTGDDIFGDSSSSIGNIPVGGTYIRNMDVFNSTYGTDGYNAVYGVRNCITRYTFSETRTDRARLNTWHGGVMNVRNTFIYNPNP